MSVHRCWAMIVRHFADWIEQGRDKKRARAMASFVRKVRHDVGDVTDRDRAWALANFVKRTMEKT